MNIKTSVLFDRNFDLCFNSRICFCRVMYVSRSMQVHLQGRSQNSKEVPQNFMEVFNIDDVKANDVIQRNQHYKEKK